MIAKPNRLHDFPDQTMRNESLDTYLEGVRASTDPAAKYVPLRGKLLCTYSLMFVSVALMLAGLVVGKGFAPLKINPMLGPSVEALLTIGGLYAPLVQNGDWWRLIWAGYLHAGWFHLLMNFILWYKLGIMVEPDWGFRRTALIFNVSVLSGNLLSATLDPYHVSVGASGGIFGIMGGCVPYVVEYWHSIPQPKCILYIVSGSLIAGLACGFMPYVDNYAHLGGALGGLLFGFVSISKVEMGSPRPVARRPTIQQQLSRCDKSSPFRSASLRPSVSSHISPRNSISSVAEPSMRTHQSFTRPPSSSSSQQWKRRSVSESMARGLHDSSAGHSPPPPPIDPTDPPYHSVSLEHFVLPPAAPSPLPSVESARTTADSMILHRGNPVSSPESDLTVSVLVADTPSATATSNGGSSGVQVEWWNSEAEVKQQSSPRVQFAESGKHSQVPPSPRHAPCRTSISTTRILAEPSGVSMAGLRDESEQSRKEGWFARFNSKVLQPLVWRPRESRRRRAPARITLRATLMTDVDDSFDLYSPRVWLVRSVALLLLLCFWIPLFYLLFVCPECFTPPGQIIKASIQPSDRRSRVGDHEKRIMRTAMDDIALPSLDDLQLDVNPPDPTWFDGEIPESLHEPLFPTTRSAPQLKF